MTHVDDFNLAGKSGFITEMTERIGKALNVSKVEYKSFRFTRIDVKEMEGSVEISINDYAESI